MSPELLFDRSVYVVVVVLLAIGMYGMLAHRNLVKKLIGMVIFQTAIYLFFIQGATQREGTVPVIDEAAIGVDPDLYVNPLPHLLILTALVVGVGVLGVALSLLLRIYRRHGTFDEGQIAANLSAEEIEGHAVHHADAPHGDHPRDEHGVGGEGGGHDEGGADEEPPA